MSGQENGKTSLRLARETHGFSRERVAAQLDPPISSKTLERWEDGKSAVKRWRLVQLAALYETTADALDDRVAA